MIADYIEAFQSIYPGHTVEVKPKKVRGEIRFQVIVDGDRGDITLSESDVKEATRAFKRGKQ